MHAKDLYSQFNSILRHINMVTSIVLIALIGTFQFNSAISAAINYEPIKITVNENFNSPSGQVSPESDLKPGVLHQGANFYFKPQLNLSPSYIPSHIEALISLIQQHHHSCAKDTTKVLVEKDKLIEILKPFMYPLSDISKETLSEIILEKENNLEMLKPITVEPKPVTPELLVISEAPVIPPSSFNTGNPSVVEEVKKEESVILEEPMGVFPTIPEIAVKPIEEPIINNFGPKPFLSKLVVIPEAPVLPPLTLYEFPPVVEEEVKKEELIIFEKSKGVFPKISEITARPITEPIINYVEPKPSTFGLIVIPEPPALPPLSLNDIHVLEEEVKIEEPIIVDVEPKPAIQELVEIPEAPALAALSLHDISSIFEKEVRKDESIILEEPTGVFPIISEIDVRPIEEPTINYVEPKHIPSEFVVIPEAPVLPPITLNGFPSVDEEEVKKEESIILEESTGEFPTITEIAARPFTEPIINYGELKPFTSGLVIIPQAPVLPPLSLNDIHVEEEEVKIEDPIIVDIEPKPAIHEFVEIPEAPVLPSLSLHDISSFIEQEVKKEKSIILEEPTGVFPTIQEIDVRPIEEQIFNYVEPKPIPSELVVIPEAPVLPPLTLNGFPSVVEEEVKKEESILLEDSTGVFPTITEIAARPITEPIIDYGELKPFTSGLVIIPQAPVLPPLSLNDIHVVEEEEVKIEEPIIVDVEPKPAIQEFVEIPEAPVLPSLSLHDISSIIEQEVKKEESIILEEPTGVFPTIPEIDVRPIEEQIFNYVEPKAIPSELVLIPEAPVLPPLTLNGFPSVVKEEVKKEKSILLEESTGVFPTITEIAARPFTEPIINYGELKPFTSGLVIIPQAPVLPPLSLNDIHVVEEEEVKIEEPIIVDVEPKPAIQEFVEIPEAPVLPSLSLHDISSIFEQKMKNEESIILEEPTGVFPTIPEIDVRPIEEQIFNYVDPKPIPSELVVIPEAPVLPPLTLNGFPSVVEKEVKKEESILLEESTGVFPTITEIAARPITEPIIDYGEPKTTLSGLLIIPKAPVLPPLSLNEIHVAEEEVKIEEPIMVDTEPKPTIQGLVEIPEAPVLPPISYNSISPIVEEAKIEESIEDEESTGVFLPIPEIFARPFPDPLETNKLSETAEYFALENNIFPVATEEVKIEIPILLEESIEVFPPIAEISSGPTLQESSPEITDSYVLEEVSQPNTESVVTVKETLPPTIIPKPSNSLGVFSYAPCVSHLSYNRAPKTKKLMIPKPASLERFLLKKHPFTLPVRPFPKLNLNAIKSSIWGNKKQFLYPTSYAHDVVEKRMAPNMAFKKQNAPKRVKIYIRSNMPKGPSYM